MQRSPLYTILFATAVCIVCAIVVSSSAVSLKERQEIYAALGLSTESYETTLVLVAGECHAKTRAVAAALRVIGGGWRWLSCIGWLPRWLADPVYSLIARNRYRWFGRHDSCMIPDADVRARFLPGGWG